jgi:hypothetical protein
VNNIVIIAINHGGPFCEAATHTFDCTSTDVDVSNINSISAYIKDNGLYAGSLDDVICIVSNNYGKMTAVYHKPNNKQPIELEDNNE